MVKSLHCVVSGKLHGTLYRSSLQSFATQQDITGWARNLDDGKVEVLAQGDKEKLDEFKKVILKGSTMSRVEHVESDFIEYDKFYDKFEIR